MPACTSRERWWLTVACVLPTREGKSQAHASPEVAMMLTSLRRTGCARTLRTLANSSMSESLRVDNSSWSHSRSFMARLGFRHSRNPRRRFLQCRRAPISGHGGQTPMICVAVGSGTRDCSGLFWEGRRRRHDPGRRRGYRSRNWSVDRRASTWHSRVAAARVLPRTIACRSRRPSRCSSYRPRSQR